MRKILIAGAAVLALLGLTATAQAGPSTERLVVGVAVGAGTGAIVAGPPGAVIGGLIGGMIGGPRLSRGHKECWYDRAGMRQCRNVSNY